MTDSIAPATGAGQTRLNGLTRARQRVHNQTTSKRRRALVVLAMVGVGAAFVAAGIWATERWSCTDQHRLLGFAGSNDRLVDIGYACANPGQGLWVQSAAAIVYGLVGASLMYTLWPDRVHIKPLQTLNGNSQAKPLSFAVLASSTFDLVENGLMAWALASAGPNEIVGGVIALVPLFAWAKWFVLGASLIAMTMITMAWIAMVIEKPWAQVLDVFDRARRGINRRLFGTGSDDGWRLFPEPQEAVLASVPCLGEGGEHIEELEGVLGGELGISCSGGGIRSAAFNLGALGALEEARVRPAPSESAATASTQEAPIDTRDHGIHGLLGEARYLASVSGGGYAATAWRTAAGTGRLPARRILGNPYEDDSPEIRYPNSSAHGEPTFLYQFARRHRHYLKNGRGGLLWSLMRTLGLMALHAGMVVGVVFTIGWPLGRLAGSWMVAGVPDGGFFDDGFEFTVGDHNWTTMRIVLMGLGLVSACRLFTRRTWTRRRYDQVLMALIALLSTLACLLIIVPWVLTNVVPPVVDGRAWTIVGAYASALGIIWGLARSELGRRAKYLGGVLLAVLLLAFGALISAQATSPGRFFTLGWLQYFLILGALAVAAVLANPDAWSLHGLYRRKLAGTFATRIVHDPDRGTSFVAPLAFEAEPGIEAYQRPRTEGPTPIICCAAARVETTKTGIAALSMTFTPDTIQVHGLDESDPCAGAVQTTGYSERLRTQRVHGRSGTLTGLAAVSGAAVAPSMGRMNMKSTNALLAALNVRLGVWLPNPATDQRRDMAPRLMNMFKELLGWYDVHEEVVYVSDGGHWENLGLVEVIRAADPECAYVICIDVSGDAPGTFNTLREAIKLARMELDVTIKFSDDEWAAITNMNGPAARNFAHGTIHRPPTPERPDGTTAQLLYVKAIIADNTPLDIQRFASEDAKFPNYSTGDQFLTDREFTHLARLGYHTMWEALCHSGDKVFGAETAELFTAHRPSHLSFMTDDVSVDISVDVVPADASALTAGNSDRLEIR